MNWREAKDYGFTAELDATGWAWQFLRRCPEYRTDHAWFAETWRALEAEYGAPPERDFFRWKQDPRSWRGESEIAGCGTETCPGENDQVLIECWMGAKWGFRKFPIDPAVDFPKELAWRDQPVQVEPVSASEVGLFSQERVALGFDLSLPIDSQLEAARRKLALLRHGLAKSGALPPQSVRLGAAPWTVRLRLLDGLDAGASLLDIGTALELADPEDTLTSALFICRKGYRRMLLLTDR